MISPFELVAGARFSKADVPALGNKFLYLLKQSEGFGIGFSIVK